MLEFADADHQCGRSAEIETLTHPAPAEALGTLLATALTEQADGASEAGLLAALAAMAPAAALRVMAEHGRRVIETAGTAGFSDAIVEALGALQPGASNAREDATRILVERSDELGAGAAVALLSFLGTIRGPAETGALERLLERFPSDPTVLRFAGEAAKEAGRDARFRELLTRLGRAERTPGTLVAIARARQQLPALAPDVRIAFVSSYTIDHLVPFVEQSCHEHALVPAAYVAPFNSWERDFIDPDSGLRAFGPDIVFLSVALDDVVPGLRRHMTPGDLEAAGDVALDRIVNVARSYAWSGGKPLVVHALHTAFLGTFGVLDARVEPSRKRWLDALNRRLAEVLHGIAGVHVLDVETACATAGVALADNPKLRHIAAMRLPPHALAAVADAYTRYIVAAKAPPRKCVVLDLDNTLWGGVVGEDGKDNLRLGDGSAGSEFAEFQEFLLGLRERGILLALASKNNEADALEVIRTHGGMVLRESAFSAMRINWKPKAENLVDIARELNIGLDALIFVDDNPSEREHVRAALPQVLTVEMPRDPALYRHVLEQLPALASLEVTGDDRARADRYRAAGERHRAQTGAADVDEFLRSLELTIEIAPVSSSTIARVAQLFAKTNQFNLTTRRYDRAELERFMRDPACGLWCLRSRDRFGEHGLVAAAFVRLETGAWLIDSLLMSCRVIGYGVETALLAYICDRARCGGAGLAGEFVPSAKNAPAADFYAKHGFVLHDTGAVVQRWALPSERTVAVPAWLEVSAVVA